MPLPKADSVKITGRVTSNTSTQEEVNFTERKIRNMGQAEFIREAVRRSYDVEEGNYFTAEKLKQIIPLVLRELNYDIRPNNNLQETSATKEVEEVKKDQSVPVHNEKVILESNEKVDLPKNEGEENTEVLFDTIEDKIISGKW